MQATFVTTSAQVQMPLLIYGTAWKKDRTADLVEKAVQCGFRGIDTACQPKHYSEAGVGQALSRLAQQGIQRETLFLQSKFTPIGGQDPLRVTYDPKAPLATQVVQSFASSQQNLGTDYLDSLVLHSPLADPEQLLSVWRAMEGIHQRGGARQLGISNCYELGTLSRLYERAEVKPSVLQNRFYSDTGYDRNLRVWCQERKLIYQSFWTLTANPELLASRSVRELAEHFDKTEAQIFYRFLTQIGIVPLIGTSSEQHMQEDLAIFSFELTSEQLQKLQRLLV